MKSRRTTLRPNCRFYWMFTDTLWLLQLFVNPEFCGRVHCTRDPGTSHPPLNNSKISTIRHRQQNFFTPIFNRQDPALTQTEPRRSGGLDLVQRTRDTPLEISLEVFRSWFKISIVGRVTGRSIHKFQNSFVPNPHGNPVTSHTLIGGRNEEELDGEGQWPWGEREENGGVTFMWKSEWKSRKEKRDDSYTNNTLTFFIPNTPSHFPTDLR